MREALPLWTRHESGIIQFRLPLPFALKWVNVYLLQDEEGWTIVDPGLRTDEAEAAWERLAAELGIAWRDIGRIVLTHYHPDHYGLAGLLQERSGAEVYLSETAHRNAQRLWGEGETFSGELADALREHGLPDTLSDGVRAHLDSVKRQVLPHPARLRLLRPGDKLAFGGADWELIGGEGHAPGHLALYDRARRLMLCGDQVLPDITPNIGWMPGGDPDPLGSYMASLRAMAAYEVDLAYPGHREPLVAYGKRVEALITHHERRLLSMAALGAELAAADADGRFSAYEMCVALFGERIVGNPHNLRFAMAETIAHLERLAEEGALERLAEEGAPEQGGDEDAHGRLAGGRVPDRGGARTGSPATGGVARCRRAYYRPARR